MALLKRYEKLTTGESYQSAYHRVMAVNINIQAGGTEVVIGIYRDETARREGKQPVAVTTCAITGEEAKGLFSDEALAMATPLKSAYTLLKRQAAYSGAEDI